MYLIVSKDPRSDNLIRNIFEEKPGGGERNG